MKILIFLILFPVISFGQLPKDFSMPHKDGKLVYELIDDSISLTKNEIFAASKKWLSDAFVNAKAVIQSEDVETGQIIGLGEIKATNLWNNSGFNGRFLNMPFSVQVDARDGRFRIRIYDIKYHDYIFTKSGEPLEIFITKLNPKQKERYNDVFIDANNQFMNLIEDFRKSITNAEEDKF